MYLAAGLKTIFCHFKIPQPLPKFPPRTYQPAKPITRKDTRDKLLQDSHQETQQQNSSEATTSNNNQTNQKQQDLPKNSCKIPPPGEVRLRPEGNHHLCLLYGSKAGPQLILSTITPWWPQLTML